MPRPRLYVSRLLPDPVMAVIADRFTLVNQPTVGPPAETAVRDGLQDAEAAICTLTERISEAVLAGAPQLKIVANYAVGYNNIDLAAAKARGIVVSNTPDVLTDATADLTWGLILAVARRLVEGDQLVRSGRWHGWEATQLLGLDVAGRVLGVVGFGRIGQAVAARAVGFRMRVLYHAPRCGEAGGAADASHAPHAVSLDRLLAEADVISLHVPLTPSTIHLIGRAQLARVKPTAILINTARGAVVDESALVEALEQGRLAGAGLDVYAQEPALHPRLASFHQVVLVPHIGSATLATRVRMGMICVENIEAVLAGREAPQRVI